MPLQHINDTMLKRMSAPRRLGAETESSAGETPRPNPEPGAANDVHHRFPRREPTQFEELVEFVREQQFERMGVFTYSYEPNTPSAALPGHLSEEVKQDRRDRLMQVQQEIAFAWNERQIGRQLDVIIDAPVPGEQSAWVGRSYADAPDVDGTVWVTGVGLSTGQIVNAEVVGTQGYDLIAVALV